MDNKDNKNKIVDFKEVNTEDKKVENINVDNAASSTEKQEEKRIDLYNLVKEYNKRSSIKLKKEFLKVVVKTKPYLNYGKKMFLADTIINTSCLKDGNVHIDSCKKYILYIYTLIKYYTNIDIKENQLLIQYDLLDEFGLVEEILELIPEKEIVTFKTILEMKQDDLMTNRYGTHAYITEQVERVRTVAPEINKAFAPFVETLTKKLETLDENKIENMLNKVMTMSKFVK